MDMAGWIECYQRRALETFGGRICFMGVQGSRARGEALEESDIDMVLILSRIHIWRMRIWWRKSCGPTG